jgi:O-antigen/teichoic acid export membrane protein
MSASSFSFNSQSRFESMLKTSLAGLVCHFGNSVAGFIYRTVFISVLSAQYLGINGLFWNILAMLALADLGIGQAIAYRFYKPIADGDFVQVGRLMRFFRQVFLLVAGVIFLLGMSLMPFLRDLVRDASEVPADVNLPFVYFLYVLQSVSSYLFAYRLSIWSADRKDYVSQFTSFVTETGRFLVQIAVLRLTRDFTWTLASGIVFVIAANIGFSAWTTRRYREVFRVAEELPRSEKSGIFKDAGALMLHRVGGAVIGSTDSIVLAKCVGLVATGLYSNYMLLMKALEQIVQRLIGGFTSNYGNVYATTGPEGVRAFHARMQFLDLALSGFAVSQFYLFVAPFIRIWIGEKMLLGDAFAIALSVQLYIYLARLTNISHISASGLFVRDKPRPLIEAALNLGISIVLARRIGVTGVVLGTIASSLLTVWWREPYLLCRHRFNGGLAAYWLQYAVLGAFPLLFCALARPHVVGRVFTLTGWMLAAAASSALYLSLFAGCFGWTRDFRSFTVRRRPVQ